MQIQDFSYQLPEELIAQKPIEPRDHSRLLLGIGKTLKETPFYNIIDTLSVNDVLVFNQTKVIPARLHGYTIMWDGNKKDIECFLLKNIDTHTWEAMVFPGERLKPGRVMQFTNNITATVKEITYSGRIIEFNTPYTELLEHLDTIGEVPLPPYITEQLENIDRYQTVFAKTPGSSAAPTASLHFTKDLLEKIEAKWVQIEYVTLHVWPGTFKPISTEDITKHQMHHEYIHIDTDVTQRLNTAKEQGKRIIAVGTTVTRVLESMSDTSWVLQSGEKETDIFIYPGYTFKFIDSLITNFHLPESSLLLLVSALAGKENIFDAYQYAIENKFRFFSFGDVMWIENKK